MKQYRKLLRDILDNGVKKTDRTGVGTLSIFGYQMRFDLSKGFPLVTTKKVPFRLVAEELFWLLSGVTNIKPLVDKGVHIWSEWVYVAYLKMMEQPIPKVGSKEWDTGIKEFEEQIKNDPKFAAHFGDLGPVYPKQWRSWDAPDGRKIDQIKDVINLIKKNPNSRRMIVTAWNPADTDKMVKSGLPPCHCFFQFYVANGKLSCQLYQRSCDTFLGVPFNIASYSMLTMMIAQVCGLKPGEFVWTGGDVHLYLNHIKQAKLLLSRRPRPLPTLKINPRVKDIFKFKFEDFKLLGYNPHDRIEAPIAV